MKRLEKAIFNRGRMTGVSDCIKRLSEERSEVMCDVMPTLADEMCKTGDDLFALLEMEINENGSIPQKNKEVF